MIVQIALAAQMMAGDAVLVCYDREATACVMTYAEWEAMDTRPYVMCVDAPLVEVLAWAPCL